VHAPSVFDAAPTMMVMSAVDGSQCAGVIAIAHTRIVGSRLNPKAQSATDDETQVLSIPVRLRRSGREITMLIDGADSSAATKPDARLIKLLIRARRFHGALIGSDRVPFAALPKQEGVSPSYFTRLVRLSYLAPDITQAILDGRQPRGLTADKLLAHSRLPLACHEQRIVLGFA
jgi:site-specific DNA recombinase